jgi:hypothetical protein
MLTYSSLISSPGPCTEGNNLTFADGGCPYPHDLEEDLFCQIQIGNRNVCADIAGQNPKAGGDVIGFECLGQWNQLFRFRSDCTISAIQPDIIGRVRSMTGNVTLCLELQPFSIEQYKPKNANETFLKIGTSECIDSDFLGTEELLSKLSDVTYNGNNLNQTNDKLSEGSSVIYAKLAAKKNQMFEFVRKGGEEIKKYLKTTDLHMINTGPSMPTTMIPKKHYQYTDGVDEEL